MRFTQDGEWAVSTPIYFGSPAQVKKAMKCDHQEGWVEISREFREGQIIVAEHCKACVATRARYRKATDTELQDKKS